MTVVYRIHVVNYETEID